MSYPSPPLSRDASLSNKWNRGEKMRDKKNGPVIVYFISSVILDRNNVIISLGNFGVSSLSSAG